MSKEKPLHQKSAQGKITRGQFHSVEHLVGTVTVQCSEIQFSVIFSFDSFSHAATVHLARCSRPRLLVRSFTRALGATLASVAPWPACAGVSCGGRLPVTADREENGGATPFGTAQILWWLRVAFSVPAHACGTVAVAQHARSALSAADGPAPPRSVELDPNTQTPASLTPKRTH